MDNSNLQSQCSIATTAKECAYRINQPNSLPRSVKAILLDENITPIFKEFNNNKWPNLGLYTVCASDNRALIANDGQREDIDHFSRTATIIILLSSQCQRTDLASSFGEYFNRNNRRPTLLLLENGDAEKAATRRMLVAARPYVSMVVRSTDNSYLTAMLSALRA